MKKTEVGSTHIASLGANGGASGVSVCGTESNLQKDHQHNTLLTSQSRKEAMERCDLEDEGRVHSS